ncbi:Splicing factor 3B subunit 2 [Camponotus floridanus]|uniref:Splicing factor 3B subunit 2 n=1 Tax=Camponotus floridanus TaxID=104421 RepID=E2ALL1_CAMFO|nr:splicing factor 3B subunit 2 [Camponotus floridanus]XP_025268485.1 splicing factor 3B subunit 2 [Camponotus floridanus]EFN65620.1 Splicing factor 3B subunit 2 [Camponotus floridanus]
MDTKTLPSLLSLKVAPPSELQNQNVDDGIGEGDGNSVKLPAALEQALAFKTERAKEIGSDPDNVISVSKSPRDDSEDTAQIEDAITELEQKSEKIESKSSKTKKKKKSKRKRHIAEKKDAEQKKDNIEDPKSKEDLPEIEYIQEIPSINDLEPMYRQFARVFEAFKLVEPEPSLNDAADKGEPIGQYPPVTNIQTAGTGVPSKVPLLDDFDDDANQQQQQQGTGENGAPRLSKRKLKRLTRLSVAELKQLVGRPDVVEMHDVTARDPKLLVQLKAHRNTVPVPRHWCFKRKYLQGKRGIEKPPFDLPDFIKRTGITEMRASLQERDDTRTLKAKMRERARPKLGKIDIDYQKLHDAFFKWQTKPRMTIHGDLYYEGKEFETRLKEKKPGELSDELRTALGMPVGPNCQKVPPPWLIAMQRYGPPPSYPNLKIPGLNAPIPEGCAFGYHAGGWGKPPVDETGRPLYGDVFGVSRTSGADAMDEEIDRGMWGEPESESSGDEDEDEDAEEGGEGGEGEGKDGDDDGSGLVTPGAEGLITPSGITSIPAGLETPETIELRKKKIESEMEGGDTPALYTVLQERRTEGLGASMMGSTHVYDMTGAAGGQAPPSVIAARRGGISGSASDARAEKDGAVELTLDPSELDLDSEAMASRYEETMRSRQAHLRREDLSDMLQDHVQRQKSKRKRQQIQDTKTSKKYKEFKF